MLEFLELLQFLQKLFAAFTGAISVFAEAVATSTGVVATYAKAAAASAVAVFCVFS